MDPPIVMCPKTQSFLRGRPDKSRSFNAQLEEYHIGRRTEQANTLNQKTKTICTNSRPGHLV
eukprot:3587670-Amphidinium_carterae.1